MRVKFGLSLLHLRRRLCLPVAFDDKDAGGSQEPIVNLITVLRYAHDRAGRL
jgi:hypothetical protein